MAKVGDILSYLTVFIVVGIMAVIGLYIVASVYGAIPTSVTAPTANCVGTTNITLCAGAYAINNSYTNTSYGVSQVMSWLPIIGIVIAAAVVLGLLLHDLFGRGGKSE